jgi:ABC-2 type transport system ATP-binding protein
MIQIQDLSKRFGSTSAVDKLSLHVRKGEFFCFLGPNGAGKTTTIKLITGLLKPTSGQVRVGGFDIQLDPIAAKRLLGYVPDHPFLYEKLTGRELLRFVAGLHGLDRDGLSSRVEGLLDLFEIRDAGDRLVEEYSHGMRQKLSFAATFLHDPRVVVVDEPWVGLDPKNILMVKEFLKKRARDGLTVFMSTHTLSIVEEVADRVGIIHRGKLLHTGSVEEIKELSDRPGSLEEVFLELTREGS